MKKDAQDIEIYFRHRLKCGAGVSQAMRETVARALRYNVIARQPCYKCGRKADVQAHHPMPGEPLNIIWFCKKHHTEIHNFAYLREWINKQPIKII